MSRETLTIAQYPRIKKLVLAADPSYKKKSVFVSSSETISIGGTYWSGGSKSTYHAVKLDTLAVLQGKQFNPPQFGGPAVNPEVAIPAGVAIIETGIFCGKTATAHITFHPSDIQAKESA
jgi:hypothetical protein